MQVSEPLQKYNKARNQYWMLPLALGILGALYQYKKDRRGFACINILFLITGLILVIYLNPTPNAPRERDYIYVGSYIAFCIWIGLGIFALYHFLPNRSSARWIVAAFSIGVPTWMVFQNYDDHNRAGRTFQMDHARNVLNSCAENAVLFTGGDNDTFPLWYLQEVEGHRTDVRVLVLSYFNSDWYIDQLRRGYYNSEPFTLTLNQKDYRQYGTNEVLYVEEKIKEGIDLLKFLQLLKEEHPGLTMHSNSGDSYHIIPSKTLTLKVDQKVRTKELQYMGFNPYGEIPEKEITFHLTERYLLKNALAFLDLLASNNWERPIYFNFTSLNTVGLPLNSYVRQEGNIFRLTPFENKSDDIEVNTTVSYKNLIEKADYTNLSNNKINFNYEDYHARMITPVREAFNSLAVAYLIKGNTTMADKVLTYAVRWLYPENLRPSFTNLQAADMLLAIGKKDLAKSLCTSLFDFAYERLQAASKNQQVSDRLDLYLATQSAQRLHEAGDEKYVREMNALEVKLKQP